MLRKFDQTQHSLMVLHDADKKVFMAYDALNSSSSIVRSTLMIDKKGYVLGALIGGSIKDHLAEILVYVFQQCCKNI